MNKYRCIVLVVLLFPFVHSKAQWSTDPANNLIVGYGLNPEMCSDSAGGCYITYESGTLGYPRQLTLTRLNRYGYKPWAGDILIRGMLPEQWVARTTEDGHGGIIISYVDDAFSGTTVTSRLRVQRVDSSGNILWGSLGVRVSISETDQVDQDVIGDGVGGCIIAWRDTLNILKIQRIDKLGNRVWGDTGIYLISSAGSTPLIVPDQSSGAIVAWTYTQVQRIGSDGLLKWGIDGKDISFVVTDMMLDKYGNVYIFGFKFIGVFDGIYNWIKMINKLSPNGDTLWGKAVLLDTEKANQPSLTYLLAIDSGGIAHVLWGNYSSGSLENYIQNLRSDGSKMFPQKKKLSESTLDQTSAYMVGGKSEETIYIWADSRSPIGYYTQDLDTIGRTIWDSSDVAVSIPGLTPGKIVSDNHGGFIFAGEGDPFSIRAQQVSRNGKLGEVLTSVNDEKPNGLPFNFALQQSWPNPFNNSTQISYTLAKAGSVTLKVYDMLGREITTLVQSRQEPGEHSVTWNADRVSSGVYFYRLTAVGFVATKRMILIK